jgi:hypothetical protein
MRVAALHGRCRRSQGDIIMSASSFAPNTPETGVVEFVDLRHLSEEQLGRLGVAQIAYVKPVILNGAPAFAIHAADGTPMAVTGDREIAIAAVRQHEMVPTLVH